MPSDRIQWLLVTTMGGAPVWIERLALGQDLRAAFLAAVGSYRSQGWLIENELDYPVVFVQKEGERRMLTISHVDPEGTPLAHFSPWKEG